MINMGLPMKWELLPIVDYAFAVAFTDYLIMQKWPDEVSRITAVLKPFTKTVT